MRGINKLSRQRIKRLLAIFIIWLCGVCSLLCCIVINIPSEHFIIAITQVSGCEGIGAEGFPTGKTNLFSSTEEAISVCGHISANNQPKVAFVVHWTYEDELIFSETVVADGYFISTFHSPNNSLRKGSYTVGISVGRTTPFTTELQLQ